MVLPLDQKKLLIQWKTSLVEKFIIIILNTAKEPYEGGAWEWHQDYGYWYNNGCLFLMATVMIALDKCRRKMDVYVLSGSNKLGRVDHALLESGQVGVDLKVEEAKNI